MQAQILTLQGNLFKVSGKFKIHLEFPNLEGVYKFTSNRLTDIWFTLIKTPNGRYYYIKYNPSLNMYIQRRLHLLEYQEQHDIRKSYKYNGKRSNKVS